MANEVGKKVIMKVAPKMPGQLGGGEKSVNAPPEPAKLAPPQALREQEDLRKMDEKLKCEAVAPKHEADKKVTDKIIDATAGDTGKTQPSKPQLTPEQQASKNMVENSRRLANQPTNY